MASELNNTTYLFGSNSVFVEELYEKYLLDPSSVDDSWRQFFSGMGPSLSANLNRSNLTERRAKIIGVKSLEDAKPATKGAKEIPAELVAQAQLMARIHMLIRAYRVRGHFLANLDPLNLEDRKTEKELNLDPEFYGISEKDYDTQIDLQNEIVGVEKTTLRELLPILKSIYSRHIGIEFMHIQSLEQKEWVQDKIESLRLAAPFSGEEKKAILKNILKVEGFEQFLHVKFPGTKRFSVEGGENSITAIDTVIESAANYGVKEIVVGMPHRGRLNVLTKVMGKSYASMLSEFQGNTAHPEDLDISGDVKYHLGTSSDKVINGNKVHLSLTANPSHLEAVDPVVVGKVRAKQDLMGDTSRKQVLGILLHGDAAFAGQGLVAETLSLSDLAGYSTGGTIHIIVNNQIGFTTSPKKARASRYPTEFGKIVQAPIFHVNGDDPEAVIWASRIATEFQQKFSKDTIIDVICFRLHGHNETDEPFFTQPLMYKEIGAHQTAGSVYAAQLIHNAELTQNDLETYRKEVRNFFDKELDAAMKYKPNEADWLAGKWSGLNSDRVGKVKTEKTGVKLETLKKIGTELSKKPESFNLNPKISRLLENRRAMIDTGENLDWAMGESLAYGSLVNENVLVRLSGQDCGRGTFSHRHAVLVDQTNENKYVPFNHISKNQASFEVIDSNLSEFAVLGFEYGYSTVEPKSLVLWEAQFGDFANGAQVIFDQFIASAEIKWLRMSGLVMLLPHGYEGMGPEHSSARLERYLQACAENNIQVVNCTTPASFFHVLRRQVCRDFRKPLVVMTPKSLLRHKLAVSSLKEMAEGTCFKPIIGEVDKIAADKDVKKVVICSGKVYYDLYEERTAKKIKDVALVRMEQYYPFPEKELAEELSKYKNAEIVWCQEEPKNMGAWLFVCHRIEEVLENTSNKCKRPTYVGRVEAASPATGYSSIHKKEQAKLVAEALKI